MNTQIPKIKSFFTYLLGFSLLFFIINFELIETRYKNSKTQTVPVPKNFKIKKQIVKKQVDSHEMQGRMMQHFFHQAPYTSGISPDELHLQFESPVEIHGLLVSVDCWKSTKLVEIAAGINQKPAYNAHSDENILMHVSFATDNTAGKIDKHIFSQSPFL